MFTGSDLTESEKGELMEKSEAILRKSDTPDRVRGVNKQHQDGTHCFLALRKRQIDVAAGHTLVLGLLPWSRLPQ